MVWAISLSLFLIFVCGVCALICSEHEREKGTERDIKKLLERLENGHDPEFEHAVLRIIHGRRGECVSKKTSSALYKVALDNLAAHPHNASAKAFVVDVGRFHLGRLRKSKKATASDDETVQHDILVRCRMVLPKFQASWEERAG
jgi:hypothetical protein